MDQLIQRGRVYDIKYNNWHHDPIPTLLVTCIDGQDVFGINLHYLLLVESKGMEYRPFTKGAMAKMIDRWKTGRFKNLFEIIESKKLERMTPKQIQGLIKARFPLVVENAYRHYKRNYIAVLSEVTSDNTYGRS